MYPAHLFLIGVAYKPRIMVKHLLTYKTMYLKTF